MDEIKLTGMLGAAAKVIELAIAEDIGPGDATSLATLEADTMVQGRIVAKTSGVVAGLPVARAVFRQVDPAIQFVSLAEDGQEVIPGELVATVSGSAQSILAAERIALNFLQRMSGIATLTRQFVDAACTTKATILDTRKTVPGHRLLDKHAVRMGGGENHRASLFDMIMIKDNHVDASGGIVAAVKRAREMFPDLPVEVEVRDLEELRQALDIQPPLDRILLDNMDLSTLREAVGLGAGKVPLEASGGVTLARVEQIASTGVDLISVGALTHSPPALDISMKTSPPDPTRTTAALQCRATRAKSQLGKRVVILGHHYQRDEVIRLADVLGDSLQLARHAAGTDAEFIVFCGVHFMAEVAAVLARPGQHVLIPDPTAGCFLADTATQAAVEQAWQVLAEITGDRAAGITPVTYVNSSAGLKAFCARHGGTVCTSSNATRVIAWALEQRPKLFFFPDQHLGRNTARRMGIAPQEMVVWDPFLPPPADVLRQARVILWPGACNVHQRFRPEHVHQIRRKHPHIQVIVHPECPMEVVDLADLSGSTSAIIEQIAKAPAGSRWAVGTETRLVRRLQSEHPDRLVLPLAPVPPYCRTMSQVTLANLVSTLEGLAEGELCNEVRVDADTAHWAQIALERMLAL